MATLPYQQRGTDPNMGEMVNAKLMQDISRAEANKTDKQKCKEGGGYWDEQTQTCVMINKAQPQTAPQQQAPTAKLTAPEVFKDQDTGKLSGITLPDGRTILASPKEIEALAQKNFSKSQIPQGTMPAGTAQAQQNAVMQQQQLNQDILTAPQMTPDGRQVINEPGVVSDIATGAAALGGALLGAKTGAKTGAAIGALFTSIAPGVSVAVGGVAGGIIGAIGGAFVKVRIQKRQSIKEAKDVFAKSKTNKVEILNMVNAGLLTSGQARGLWQEEKQNILSSYVYLKQQTQNDLDNFLGDPGEELMQVESYLNLDNLYDLEFETALMQPNPLNVRYLMESEDG